MTKLLLVLFVSFIFVTRVRSGCNGDFWCCVNNGGCSSEELSSTEDGDDQPGDPISDQEIEDGETFQGTEPDDDPSENDENNFEGDMKGLTADTIEGYAKDASEIQETLQRLTESDPKGHMDISSLHLDPAVWRNAITSKHGLWPKAQIPYVISSRFKSNQRKQIAAAMAQYHKRTCIRFVGRTHESDYIYIKPLRGCWSYVGRQAGMQELSVGSGCEHKGIIIHELMHAAGFFHEQSRTDRDKYVTINWNNIPSRMYHNFKSYGTDKITDLDTGYDYKSIMHYSKYAFSMNRRPTIIPKRSAKIGQRKELSSNDVRKLNKLYQCNSRKQCNNKKTWCQYNWLKSYCFCGWIQRFCPKTCELC